MKYPHLFSPVTIRGKTFKNRILVAPMGIEEDDNGGAMTQRGIEFYEDVAAGGCARVCSGENDVSPGTAVRGMYHFYVDVSAPDFKESIQAYADACHRHGALAFTSFNHMGIYMRAMGGEMPGGPGGEGPGGPGGGMPMFQMPKRADGTPYEMPKEVKGPSAMTICEPHDGITKYDFRAPSNDGKIVGEFTETDLEQIADDYAHCALVCKQCGLDGMIIHGGHGFLFGQFVAKRTNKRTDQYGGSAENRARFPIMCLQRIRDAVGDDFIVELRFSGEENINAISKREYLKDTLTLDDTIAFFKEVDKHPGLLDIAHISGGVHVVPALNTRVTANSYWPMAMNVECAAAVKKEVKNFHVAVVGSLADPALCEEIIASGKADFVVMARQLLIADPEFPNKAQAGLDDEINNCLRCVSCRSNGYCSVNPVDWMIDDRSTLHISPADEKKKVAVIGGGIGGLKAAEVAAKRGHRVVLFEKENRLGGILRYAETDCHKQDIHRWLGHMINRVKSLGVDIQLGVEADAERVKSENADAVIVAMGGKPKKLPVAGGEKAVDSLTAYLEPEKVGETVAVIGGGLTGCEAAIHWQGLGKRVTLISRSAELMPRVKGDGQNVNTHLITLHELGVKQIKGVACKEVTDTGVVLEDGTFVEAATVINAAGMSGNAAAAEEFRSCAPKMYIIGDCREAGLITDAVRAAYEAAMEI
ncbi:MAG: FAD-dependent oxidoreductase [Ruminococcaceae bacterium]|nr:FAD-dependent oxidoreductase [Oscillospiraceae bacterium]